MPYAGDILLEDTPLAMIQSDLQDSVEAGYSSDRELNNIGPTTTVTTTISGVSVFNLGADEFGGDDEDVAAVPPPAPEADMGLGFDDEEPVPEVFSSSAKKRGRPSRSASGTPAKSVPTTSKTPRSAKSTTTPKSAKSASAPKSARASAGRKRKAEEIAASEEPEEAEEEESEEESEEEETEEAEEAEPTPAAKRGRTSGRPSRTAGVAASARLVAKAANKPKRGRPKSTDTSEKKPKGKAGRPKKNAAANGEVPAGEYEVEAIRDSRIDAETMGHWYQVKWKGYPESDNSWEPKTNLKHALDLVKAFDKKKKKQEIEEAVAKAKETVAKKPKAAPKSKAVKPVKKAKAAPAKKTSAIAPAGTAGRRGRPARATRGSK
ncbi:hypothetical protein QBC44DRAFT_129790 [Cladorrhinum sp. PSN332]|nr:hypothetical protein QBC44DRAFT_129790 [Cladorrhinum sp. PSN332]